MNKVQFILCLATKKGKAWFENTCHSELKSRMLDMDAQYKRDYLSPNYALLGGM